MTWDIQHRRGFWLPQSGWWLDARVAVPRSFVSHAHSDHVAAHREIICTAATARLVRERLSGSRTEHVLPFGHAERLSADAAITLYPAGHVLGSAQCLLTHERLGTLLYTGDFQLRPAVAAESCATPRADVLIMETTFGLPRYVFPPASDVFAAISDFCRSALDDGITPVLAAYSLGKSQELLLGLGPAKLPVMLHASAFRLTQIYEELGVKLPPYHLFDSSAVGGHVVICPPFSSRNSILPALPKHRVAAVTGWALDPGAVYRYKCDAAFPLSDHSDFPGLIEFVQRVQPRLVYTVHGFAREFAGTLRARGIEAWALGEDNQLDLGLA
jgi:Cft2 family RNA processing exonuclease